MEPKEMLECGVGYRLDEPLDEWFDLIENRVIRDFVRYKFGFVDGRSHAYEDMVMDGYYDVEYIVYCVNEGLGTIRAEAYNRDRPIVTATNYVKHEGEDSWRNIDYDPWEVVERPKTTERTYHFFDSVKGSFVG